MVDIKTTAGRLNHNLNDCEHSLDDNLSKQASMMLSACIALQHSRDLDQTRVQKTLMQIHKSMGELISARGLTARVHGELLEFGRELGMTEEPTCPDQNFAQILPLRAG